MTLEQLTCSLIGMPDTTDHRRILGVPTHRHDVIAIDTALRRRLAQLYSHPLGRTSEANKVKEFLEGIAKRLKASAFKEPVAQHEQPELTPLDQSILAVLISQGGWNRQSRARLVAVAASYQITVGGLMRILEALGESARSGEGPLSKKRRSKTMLNSDWTKVSSKSTSVVDDFISKTAQKLAPELKSPSPVMTIKIAVLFGLLTILAFVLSLQVLLAPDTPQPVNELVTHDSNSNLFDAPEINEVLIKPYETFPELSFEVIDVNVHDYGDRLLSEVQNLQSLRDEIELTLLRGDTPDDAWAETLDSFIQLASIGWFYITPQTRDLLLNELISVFIEIERNPALSEQFITLITPQDLILDDPSSLNAFVLKSELIAGMRCSQRLTPRLRATLTSIQDSAITSCLLEDARTQALGIVAMKLVNLTELEARTIGLWQSWIGITDSLQDDALRRDTYHNPMSQILDSTIDLTRESRTRQLLGSLIKHHAWDSSNETKEFVTQIFSQPDYSDSKLWVIGHLLTESSSLPWTDRILVIQPNESPSRIKIQEDIEDSWPEEVNIASPKTFLTIPAGYNQSLTSDWMKLYETVKLNSDDVRTLLTLRMLNESAAAIWQGRPGIAQRVFASIGEMDIDVIEISQSFPSQPEGWWRDQFYDARNDVAHRLELIDNLIGSNATDLRPEDAERLASASLTNSNSKIRRAATKTIIEQFPHGRNVAIALLNQLQRSKATSEISALVSNLTEVVLPSKSDSTWPLVARKALLQHAIALETPHSVNLDTLAYELAQSLSTELLFISPKSQPPSGDVSPVHAFEMLIQVRRRLLQDMYELESVVSFTPQSVMQQYLHLQLQYLELLVLEELQWRSLNTHEFIMPDISSITQASNVTRQLILAENAIAQQWRSRLVEIEQLHEKRSR